MQNKTNDYYIDNLFDEINIITIKYNETLTDCSLMFFLLTNITIIDLSSFDSSKVENMNFMFSGCCSLIS